MGGLAEEVGLVGGDRVDQVQPLAGQVVALENELAIGVDAALAGGAHAAAQPALQHGDLALGHLDAGIAVDEAGEPAEIAPAQPVHAGSGAVLGGCCGERLWTWACGRGWRRRPAGTAPLRWRRCAPCRPARQSPRPGAPRRGYSPKTSARRCPARPRPGRRESCTPPAPGRRRDRAPARDRPAARPPRGCGWWAWLRRAGGRGDGGNRSSRCPVRACP